MNKKLKCVLLIDDDGPTNFLHKIIVDRSGYAEQVVIKTTGTEALKYLTTEGGGGAYPQPDLIFLDINMPGMDGWEFMEAYKKLDKAQRGQIVIVMLTTSTNQEDRDKAEQVGGINNFHVKPLTQDIMSNIYQEYFS